MMTTQELRDYAALADMAYANLTNVDLEDFGIVINAANVQERTPIRLGLALLENGWQVDDYYDDEGSDTGFAATTFRNGNEIVLAIRGSEPPAPVLGSQLYEDWLTSNFQGIGKFGIAVDQAVSLFNYVQRLRAPEGESVLQLDVIIAGDIYTLSTNTDGVGLGVIQPGDEVNVVGHSLGGHLAMVAKRLFPELFGEVHSFNGAHFNPKAEIFFSFVDAAMAAVGSDIRTADSFDEVSGGITRYISEDSSPGDDAELVTSSITGLVKPGQEVFLRTEVNSHSAGQIVDDLSIFSLLESLNPNLTNEELTRLYDASSGDAGKTQEIIVGKLSKLLLNDDRDIANASASWATASDFTSRSELHERIVGIEAMIGATPGLVLKSLVDVPSSELISKSNGLNLDNPDDAVAWRYALKNLNPFIITGFDYLQHNQNGELNAGYISQKYMEDRAAFLELLVNGNEVADNHLPSTAIAYRDLDQGIKTASPLYVPHYFFGSANDETLNGVQGSTAADHIYGGGGYDTIYGRGGADYLEGNQGDDILYGSGPNEDDEAVDELLGGEGDDTYLANYGDVIEDSDGFGRVLFGTDVLYGGVKDSGIPGTYNSLDGQFVYYWDIENTLTVTRKDENGYSMGSITIRNFDAESNDLGIVLAEMPEGLPDELAGDDGPDTLTVDSQAYGLIFGNGGNDEISLNEAYSVNVSIYGGEGNDSVRLDADDVGGGVASSEIGGIVFGEGGDDRVTGGRRRDFVDGGTGHEQVEGLAGKDILNGGAGNDWLDGNGEGDIVQGGDGVDYLLGGADGDTLFGGAGDDSLYGDAQGLRFATWDGAAAAIAYVTPDDLFPAGDFGFVEDVAFTDAGHDSLFGEAGNDTLIGGTGTDLLMGGADDDTYVFEGEWGVDVVREESGVDTLRFDGGLTAGDMVVRRQLDSLLVEQEGTGNSVLLEDWFAAGGPFIEGVEFSGGTGLTMAEFLSQAGSLQGGEGDDALTALDGSDDSLSGGGGNDILFALSGDDANHHSNLLRHKRLLSPGEW